MADKNEKSLFENTKVFKQAFLFKIVSKNGCIPSGIQFPYNYFCN